MISHCHKTIFVHIPKNGGQSIESMFLSDLGLSPQQRAPLLMLPNSELSVGPPRLAHLLASEYTKYHYISQELYNNYFSFSVVRNPWHRVYSFYKYLTSQIISFKSFVCSRFYSDYYRQESSLSWFVRPQVDYIYDRNKNTLVDRVYMLENLDAAHLEIINSCNLSASSRIPRVNVSSKSRRTRLISKVPLVGKNIGLSVSEAYDDKSFAIIKSLYAEDCEAFGYSSL